MRKASRVLVAAAMLSIGTAMAGYGAEWKQTDGRWWYQFDDGTYAQNQIYKIGRTGYLFDSEGYMVTGWKEIGSYWYYADASGALAKEWKKIGNKWYYFDKNFVMQTGWLKLNYTRYYLNLDGSMQTGLFEVDGVWYQANPDTGAVIRNKKEITDSKKKLRYNSDGSIETWSEARQEWEPIISSEEYKESMMELLRQEYSDGKYRSEEAFEKTAEQRLEGRLSQEELDDFITDCIFHYAPER